MYHNRSESEVVQLQPQPHMDKTAWNTARNLPADRLAGWLVGRLAGGNVSRGKKSINACRLLVRSCVAADVNHLPACGRCTRSNINAGHIAFMNDGWHQWTTDI